MTSRLSRMGPQPRDVAESSSDDDDCSGERDAPTEFLKSTLSRFSRVGLQPRDVVEISSDDGGSPVPAPRTRSKKGKDHSDDDDDCVVLDGDPDKLLSVVGAKVRTSGDDASDEVEIVAAKGQIACKDFPHSCHLCVDLPFSTTSHMKCCSMCYCFVCDVPAPCKYWGQGLLDDDHCHATDKEAKWKELRQAFKCKSLPASYSEKHLDDIARGSRRMAVAHRLRTSEAPLPDSPLLDVVYPTTPSARQVRMENLLYHMDREDLHGLFYHAGIVVLSEILYDRETGQSLGCGLVTMNTVEEAEKAVELYHHSELCGRLVTVSNAAATGGRAEETLSPRRSVSSTFILFVNNLSPEVDGCELKRLFSGFGEVVHASHLPSHRSSVGVQGIRRCHNGDAGGVKGRHSGPQQRGLEGRELRVG